MQTNHRTTSAIVQSIMLASSKKKCGLFNGHLFLGFILFVLGFTFSESASQCVTPPSGLVSWWPGDDNANDIQGSNHGALQNGATFAPGMVGQAFSFDGVNDYVSIPHNPALQPTQITVAAWIKANPMQSYTHYLVVDKSHGWTDATGWVLQGETSSGRIAFSYGNGVDFPELYSTTNLLDDNWHFVTGTLDGSDLKIYVDGILEGSLAYSGTPAGNSRSVNIGASWGGGTFNRFFNGLIDEVDIYNRALSAQEIADIYNAGSAGKCTTPPVCVTPPSGLVSWWPGDGNTNDIQSSINGTLIDNATFAAGLVDEAFSFDGSGDYVSVPDNPAWNFGMNDFTIDLWVRFNQVKNSLFIHQQYDFGGGFEFYYQAGFGSLVFNLSGFSNAIARMWTPQANAWYHVAVTRTSGAFRLYVNGGQLENEQYNPNPVSDVSGILRIGDYAGGDTDIGGGYDVNGLIDEIEIFNRALSASEIQAIYNAGSAGKCKDAPATEVTLTLLDQNGALIPASQFDVAGQMVPQGGTISLPAGFHAIRLFPGLNGSTQGSLLHRVETVSVSGAAQTVQFTWVTASLQINLVDQNNAPIPASQFTLGSPLVSLGDFPNGATNLLPVTEDPATPTIDGPFADGYSVTLFPGLNGVLQGSLLHRDEECGEFTATGLNRTFVWATASLQINLVDQNNVPIPASQFTLGSPLVSLGDFPNGATNVLPVTEDPATPTIDGPFANGYSVRLFPGLNGVLQGSLLHRDEECGELSAAGLNRTFVWATASLQINFVDQNNVPIPASQFTLGSPLVSLGDFPNGATNVLPVTEDPAIPTINGPFANGYSVRLFPGLNGNLQGGVLFRDEVIAELIATGIITTFTWEIATGTLHVVDISENEISGSSIDQPFLGTISTGAFVSMPVNDNGLYPTIAGTFADGYGDFRIQTIISNPFAGPFTFKILSGEIFDPAFVTIDGAQYGLRFDLQPAGDCVTPPSGLVSWWPGDDNANDIKDGNNGTLQHGATLAAGKVGQGFSLDGVDDFVNVANSANLNIVNNFTVDAWIFPTVGGYNNHIFTHGLSCSSPRSWEIDFGDVPPFTDKLIFDYSLDGSSANTIYSTGAVPLNQWSHIAVTFDNGQVTFYIDGQQSGSQNIGGSLSSNTKDIRIGGGQCVVTDALSRPFTGKIDEVDFFNRAITAQEIQAIYTAGSAGKSKTMVTFNPVGSFQVNDPPVDLSNAASPSGGVFSGPGMTGTIFDPALAGVGTHTITYTFTDANNCSNNADQSLVVNAVTPCVTPLSGLVSWWPGDGNAGDIKDGNDGAIQNGATFASGKVGQAFSFDGVDDFVTIPHAPNLALDALTVNAWIRRDRAIGPDEVNYEGVVTKESPSTNGPGREWFLIVFGNGRYLRFAFTDNGENEGSSGNDLLVGFQFLPGVWYHIAATFNGATIRLYVNGQELGSLATRSNTIFQGLNPLRIGIMGTLSSRTFDGRVDEVDIFNRALTAQEIASIYNAGSAGKCKECTPPEVSITGNDPVFTGATHTYAATTDATNPSFEWSVTGGTINGSNANSSVSITAGAVGTMMLSVNVIDGVTNCSKEETKEVTINPLPGGRNEVVLATNSVWLKEHAKVLSGNVIVNNASSGPVLDSQVELSVGHKVTTPVGFALKADRIKVKQGAVVESDVFYNELMNNGTVNGTQNSPLTLPVFAGLPEFHQAPPGTQDITVNKDQSITLAAGAYRDVLVKQNGTIVFTGGGTFALRSLNTGAKAKLFFDSPTEILIEGKLDTDENSYIGPQTGSGIGASEIIFYVAGINGNNGNLGASPKTVQLGLKNTVSANFYAPNGTVWLRQGSVATGAFLGKDVIVGENVQLALESAFGGGSLATARVSSQDAVEVEPSSETEAVKDYGLEKNYPNPFNPSTMISFALPEDGEVRLMIYTLTGQLVKQLASGRFASGKHEVMWNGRDENGAAVASGIYFYQIIVRMQNGEAAFSETKRMTLVK